MCGAKYVVPNMWCQMCGANMCGAKYVVPNVWCQYVWCQGIPRNLARFGGFPRDLDDVTGHVTRTDQSEAEFGAGSGRKWHPKGSGTSKKTGSCAVHAQPSLHYSRVYQLIQFRFKVEKL